MIQLIAARAQSWWRGNFSALSLCARLYGCGVGFLMLSCIASVLRAPNWFVHPVITVAGVLLIAGFVGEAYAKLVKLAKKTWFKWVMVPIAAMVFAASLGGAAHVVAEATAQDPSYFPLAVSFLAPLAVVPALALVGAIALGALSLAMIFSLFLSEKISKVPEKEPTWLALGRVLGVISTTFALSMMVDPTSPLGRSTVVVAGWAAYVLDMHKDTECGFDDRDRVKRINDELVIRMQPNGSNAPTFTRHACVLGPQ